jgi:hypothetical protein
LALWFTGDAMDFQIDFIFRTGAGYDDLVALIQANPRYVFEIWTQDKIDKRTTKSKDRGWVEIKHKQHSGVIKLSKSHGVCRASVTDESGGKTHWRVDKLVGQ